MTTRSHQATAMCPRAVTPRWFGRACGGLVLAAAACMVPEIAWAQSEPTPSPAPPSPAPPSPAPPVPPETATPPETVAPPPETLAPPPTTVAPPPTTVAPPPELMPPPMTASPPVAAAPAPPTMPPTETKAAEGRERTLAEHVLQYPTSLPSAVVVSNVGVRIRLGEDSVSNLPTEVGVSEITSVTLNEGLDLGIKITDWLGVFVTGGVRSLIGTNLRALTYAGATYDMGGVGGAILRLFRSDRTGTQLSLVGSVSHTRGQFSSLLPIFERPVLSIVDALRGDLGSSIVTPFNTTAYDGSLAFAQGFGRLFGLQLSAGLGGSTVTSEPYDRVRRERGSRKVNGVTYELGVAPSIDFNAFHVPIAVMPEYVLVRRASDAQLRGSGSFDTRHQLALGVYYSGRVNLQVGLAWSTVLGTAGVTSPTGQSDSPSSHAANLILRYVF